MEEIEDWGRGNNLQLRGLPEATGAENLPATTLAIYQQLAGDLFPASLEFDRIHRVLGTRSPDPERPRDVICRIHCYSHKEIMMRKAWEAERVEFDGAVIKILPDLDITVPSVTPTSPGPGGVSPSLTHFATTSDPLPSTRLQISLPPLPLWRQLQLQYRTGFNTFPDQLVAPIQP